MHRPVTIRHFRTTETDSAVRCERAIESKARPTRRGRATARSTPSCDRSATGLRKFEVLSYSEHSLGKGAEARAVSYIQIKTGRGRTLYGAGIDTNIELASIKAIVSALNRTLAK